MVVAVVTVRVMQMAVNQVVDMVTMRYRGMAAPRAVNVIRIMAFTSMRCATVGVQIGYLYAVLVVVAVMGAVQVPVMQIAHMVVVLDGDVTTTGAVFVRVILVNFVCHFPKFLTQ